MEITSSQTLSIKLASTVLFFDQFYTYYYRDFVSFANNIGLGFETTSNFRWLNIRPNLTSSGNEYLEFVKDPFATSA